jgi:Xaa-Pro dipeptidase
MTAMPDLGTVEREDAPRVDFPRLRAERRSRCLEAMERHGLDVLVLGREANARYVAGARRLWTAGTRAFAPTCVLVRATGDVHLLSTWEDGIPEEIPRENLYGVTWNPMNLVTAVSVAPRVAQARRIGVDAMTPLFSGLFSAALPGAEIVDATPALRSARATKLPDEIGCIRTALAIAESGLSCSLDLLDPGVSEGELRGAFSERMTAFGVTVPGAEASFRATATNEDRGRAAPPDSGPFDDGRLVACAASALYAGYEGSLARTWLCSGDLGGRRGAGPTAEQRRLHERWVDLWGHLLTACRPGADARELRAVYLASGEPASSVPVAHGLGLGMEPPLVGASVDDGPEVAWTLTPGTVLSVGARLDAPGVGSYVAREVVLVTETGAEMLSTHSHGPLAW